MDPTETILSQTPEPDIATILQYLQRTNLNQNQAVETSPLMVNVKLNDRNYPIWSKPMGIFIKGRGGGNHITGQPPAPPISDSKFLTWDTIDNAVKGWIINSIEPTLVPNFLQYSTAQNLWEGLEATYNSGTNYLQNFELMTRASQTKQGNQTLEQYYSNLQVIWAEINQRQPNRFTGEDNILLHNRLTQERRLYQFIAEVNDRSDPIKRDVLNQEPLPSLATAYALIRREVLLIGVMLSTETQTTGEAFAAK